MHIYAAHFFIFIFTVSSCGRKVCLTSLYLSLFWISTQHQQTLLEDQSATTRRERTAYLPQLPNNREVPTIYTLTSWYLKRRTIQRLKKRLCFCHGETCCARISLKHRGMCLLDKKIKITYIYIYIYINVYIYIYMRTHPLFCRGIF